MSILRETNLPNLYHRGKVRDTYEMGGDMLLMVWTAEDRPEQAELVLYQIGPGSWAGEKVQPRLLEHTLVNGSQAVWAEGPYLLYLSNGELELSRLVSGRTLLWEENLVTYRLESRLDLAGATRIAESLAPYP